MQNSRTITTITSTRQTWIYKLAESFDVIVFLRDTKKNSESCPKLKIHETPLVK